MKKLLALIGLLPWVVQAQVGPPPATAAETAAGTDSYKYVTAAGLAGAGIGTGGATNGQTAAQVTNIVNGMRVVTTFNVGGSSMSTTNAVRATNDPAGRLLMALAYTNVVKKTVSNKGIANSLSTITNNGAMFGPDTPSTVTSGLQEALNSINTIGNAGPTVGGVSLEMEDGYYYFTNALIFSNTYPRGITIKGENMLSTKLIFAGASTNVDCIRFAGWPTNRSGSLNLPVHLTITDMGFSSITNSTNILLHVMQFSQLSLSRCAFTSWQAMTNQVDGAGFSLDNNSMSGVTLGSTVGLLLTDGPDHGAQLTDLYFMGLATGMYARNDHVNANGLKFAFIGTAANNRWPATSPYSLGACILSDGGLDSLWTYCHFYASSAGFVLLEEANSSPVIDHGHFESVTYPAGVLYTNTVVPLFINPVMFGATWNGVKPVSYWVTNAPNFGFIATVHTNSIAYGRDTSVADASGASFQVYRAGALGFESTSAGITVNGTASINSGNFTIDANPELGLTIGDNAFANYITLEPAGNFTGTGTMTNTTLLSGIIGTDSNGKFKKATLSGLTWNGTTLTATAGGGGGISFTNDVDANGFGLTNASKLILVEDNADYNGPAIVPLATVSSQSGSIGIYGGTNVAASSSAYGGDVILQGGRGGTGGTEGGDIRLSGGYGGTAGTGGSVVVTAGTGGGASGTISLVGATSVTGDVAVSGNVPVTGIIIGNGRSITNIPVVALYSATNTWGSQTFDFNVAEATTNMAAAITITGLVNTGVGKTNYDHIVRYILASGSDRTFTPSAGTFVNGVAGAPAFVCTNGQLTTINVVYQGGNFTNLTHVP